MIALLASLALLQVTEPAAAQAQPDQPVSNPSVPAADTAAPAALDRDAAIAGINRYLNDLQTLRARFTQVAPDGSSAGGLLSLSRPGRLRFEYDEPSPIRMIADGTTVAIEDRALETVDRAPLRSTPLWWLLKPEIDLEADARITGIGREYGYLYVTMEDPDGEMQGEITFVFAEPSLELREWYVVDALNEVTRVTLSDVATGQALDPRLFVIPEAEDTADSRRGRR